MIIAGLISLLQILFFPGLILNAVVKKESGLVYRICYIVAFSLLFNFVYSVILVSIHAYVFIVILITIIIEAVLILFLYRKEIARPISTFTFSLFTRIKSSIVHYFETESRKITSQRIMQVIKAIALLLALVTLGWLLFDFVAQIGTVFSKWDSVVSYNRWATEWSKGLFPTGACEYPQLLPTNWSLTYVFTQSSIGIFAKLVQGVFPFLFVLAMLDIGLTLGSAGFLFGAPISMLILKKFAGVSLFEGYMDVAVTAFILLSFYMILKDLYQQNYSTKTLWLSGIVILAAAMSKQPGILAFGAWVLINFFILLSKNPHIIWESIKKLFLPAIVILLLIVSWYIFKMNRDVLMGEPSCLAITNSWAANDLRTGFWNIFLSRLKLLDLWVILIPIFLISIFFSMGGIKWVLLCFGLPYLLISLSYGLPSAFIRYLAPISFIFAFSASILIDLLIKYFLKLVDIFPFNQFTDWNKKILRLLTNLLRKITRFSFWWILILGILVLVLLGIKYPDSKLVRNYEYQQMGIGNRTINNYLVDFYKDKDSKDLTLTWYPFINFLPGLEGRSVYIPGGSIEEVSEYLKREDIRYVLQYNATPEETSIFLQGLMNKGQLKFITDFGTKNDATLYEVIRK